MTIAKKISTILCDDIRGETGNKFSLMGVYPKNIVVKDFPALLPKLCLCIRLDDVKSDFRSCDVTLKSPDSEPTVLRVELGETPVGSHSTIFAVIVPFRAKAPGAAKFEVRFGKNKRPSVVHKFELQKAKQ